VSDYTCCYLVKFIIQRISVGLHNYDISHITAAKASELQSKRKYSPGVRRRSIIQAGASILGSWGSYPLDFGQGGRGGRRGGRRRGRGRVLKYYNVLLCTGSMFETDDF